MLCTINSCVFCVAKERKPFRDLQLERVPLRCCAFFFFDHCSVILILTYSSPPSSFDIKTVSLF